MVPWTTPPIINAWLSTAGSMGAVVTQIVCILVSVLIYLPFVKVAARRADAAEAAEAKSLQPEPNPNRTEVL